MKSQIECCNQWRSVIFKCISQIPRRGCREHYTHLTKQRYRFELMNESGRKCKERKMISGYWVQLFALHLVLHFHVTIFPAKISIRSHGRLYSFLCLQVPFCSKNQKKMRSNLFFQCFIVFVKKKLVGLPSLKQNPYNNFAVLTSPRHSHQVQLPWRTATTKATQLKSLAMRCSAPGRPSTKSV